MSWRILQIGTGMAVAFANVYFEWMDNGYAVGVLSVFTAMVVTYLVSWAIDLWRWWRYRRLLVR